MYRVLRAKSRRSGDRAIDLATRIIQTPSPSLHEAAVAETVQRSMEEAGFDKVLHDEAGNVVGIMLGRDGGPTVLLNSHMDTVEPGADWKEPPFSGRVDNGRLYGLGAADCKAGLAAQIYAAELLKRSLLPMRGNLVVAASVAEQNGRSVGVRTLMETTLPQLELRPDYALLGECTGLGIYYGHDGWMEIEIRVEGANPFQVDDTARLIHQDIRTANQLQNGRGQEEVNVSDPQFDTRDGVRRASIGVDCRLSAGDEPAHVVHQLQHEAELIAGNSGSVAVEVAIRQEQQRLYTGTTTLVRHIAHAWSIDPFHWLMGRARQGLQAAGCQVRCDRWRLGRLGMGTAGGVLVNEYQVPTLGYGPGNEELAHAAGEYVETDSIVEAMYGTASIVHSLIGIPVFGWTSDEI
jgi:acetylornithine deacetylase/succinyl-diaminopimelate desuccinylase-like protein